MNASLGTSPQVLAFLRDARERPEEDTSRLTLADYPDDHGDHDRAEFVRLQCRLAPGQAPLEDSRRERTEDRCEDLRDRRGGCWLGPLWRWPASPMCWHRGLLSVRLTRKCDFSELEDVLPWIDTALFVLHARGGLQRVAGLMARADSRRGGRPPPRSGLQRVAGLMARAEVNHLHLGLRSQLGERPLSEALARLPESACLRSLSIRRPLALLRGPGFLAAQEEAARTASRDAARLATDRILLRGREGTLVATDGRRLLQAGFRFPWRDDRYLPALPVFGGRELPRDQPITLGMARDRITLGVGPWLFDFGVEGQVRFPDVDKVVPNDGTSLTRLHLDARDVEELIRRLPRLPAHDDPRRPVTLELGDTIAVRSRSEEGEASEVVLPHAKREGPALRAVMGRRYLLRALKLGFTEILLANARTPLVCRDARRTYLWMPLSDADSVPAAPVPHAWPVPATERSSAAHPETSRSTTEMPANESRSDSQQRNGSADPGEPPDPITQA